jgi:hypothetical protein
MSNPPHALDVTPETELTFNLSRSSDVNSRVTMTLHHPGNTDEYLAFKVGRRHCIVELSGVNW